MFCVCLLRSRHKLLSKLQEAVIDHVGADMICACVLLMCVCHCWCERACVIVCGSVSLRSCACVLGPCLSDGWLAEPCPLAVSRFFVFRVFMNVLSLDLGSPHSFPWAMFRTVHLLFPLCYQRHNAKVLRRYAVEDWRVAGMGRMGS